MLQSNSLKLNVVSDNFPVEVGKTQWCDAVRKRCDSGLWKYSDEELEKGLEEMEEKYKSINIHNFDLV